MPQSADATRVDTYLSAALADERLLFAPRPHHLTHGVPARPALDG